MSISLNLSIAYFLPRLFHIKFTSFQPSGDRKINENHIFPNSLYYIMTAEISPVDNENSTIRLLFCQIVSIPFCTENVYYVRKQNV